MIHDFFKHYTNRHQGETCIILGNGPSIGDYDLSDPFFMNSITLGSNAIGRVFYPSYYFMGDPGAYLRYGKYVHNPRSIPCLGEYIEISNSNLLRKGYVCVKYDTRNTIGRPTLGRIYHGRTSGIIMIHMAYQMGFKYVFTLGIDGYGVAGESHFFEGSAGRATSDEVVRQSLALALEAYMVDGRYLYDLSGRSVFGVLPQWHEVDTLRKKSEIG